MARQSYIFTSESVSEGHPDKVADRISDTVVDAFLSEDPVARVACETLVTTQRIVLAGEVRAAKPQAKASTTKAKSQSPPAAKGGTRAKTRAKTAQPAARTGRSTKVHTPKGQVAPNAAKRDKTIDDGPVPASGWAVVESKPPAGRMNTDDLMNTAARAITEIVSIGLESVRESIGSVLGRIPRP